MISHGYSFQVLRTKDFSVCSVDAEGPETFPFESCMLLSELKRTSYYAYPSNRDKTVAGVPRKMPLSRLFRLQCEQVISYIL